MQFQPITINIFPRSFLRMRVHHHKIEDRLEVLSICAGHPSLVDKTSTNIKGKFPYHLARIYIPLFIVHALAQ